MIRPMRAAILAVGSELLGTERLDTNSLRLAESLERYGVELVAKYVVGDQADRIENTVSELVGLVDLVLITGGLGPTSDDLTRPATARALGRSLSIDPTIVEDIRSKFAAFGREMSPSNERQAEVPLGARVIENPRGTAPGLVLEHGGSTFFLFPGVPRELEGMIETSLEPWLSVHGAGTPEHRRVLRVACLPESEVEDRLAPAYEALGEIGLLASPGDIRVCLRASRREDLERAEGLVRSCLGEAVYGVGEVELEEAVGQGLREHGLTLATAESCTGGWIAQRLTAVAGSSDYFPGGIVAYDNRIKAEQLGVPQALIDEHGVVSREVVSAMARGANERLGSDWAVAVSGIAGPGGGSAEKPVGRVELALARSRGEVDHRQLQLPGDRRTIRLLTTQWALDLVRLQLAALKTSPV